MGHVRRYRPVYGGTLRNSLSSLAFLLEWDFSWLSKGHTLICFLSLLIERGSLVFRGVLARVVLFSPFQDGGEIAVYSEL
jgi:hypothetical protein